MTVKSKKTIKLDVGNEYKLALKSLATAGYLWTFEVDNSFITAVAPDEPKVPKFKPDEEMVIGTSYDEVFKIHGVGPGETTITFSQARPFEFGPPHEEKIVTVIVG